MKEIKLTQNQVTLVDDEDYVWLCKNTWYAHKYPHSYYAERHGRKKVDKHNRILKMHKEIWIFHNSTIPTGYTIDHINNNGLDNQKENLRLATYQQNSFNRRANKNSSSKYKGISYYKNTNKWRAQIKHNGKLIHLGLFDNEIDAAKVYDKEALKLYKEYAKFNFSV